MDGPSSCSDDEDLSLSYVVHKVLFWLSTGLICLLTEDPLSVCVCVCVCVCVLVSAVACWDSGLRSGGA